MNDYTTSRNLVVLLQCTIFIRFFFLSLGFLLALCRDDKHIFLVINIITVHYTHILIL